MLSCSVAEVWQKAQPSGQAGYFWDDPDLSSLGDSCAVSVQRKSSQAVVPEVGDAKKDQKADFETALVFWSIGLCCQGMNQAAPRWGIGEGD